MFYYPMLLGSAPKAYNDENMVWEPKNDGHRLLYSRESNKTELWTRHKTLKTEQYPELLDLKLSSDFIIDGEVCLANDQGNVDFELIMERFALRKTEKIKRAALTRPVNYIVWDIPYYKKDIRHLPLTERRNILEQVLPPHPLIRIVPQFDGNYGEALYQIVEQKKLEGLVGKLKNSKYVCKRSDDWRKVIRWQYAEVAITGFSREEFGWFAAVEENGKYRPAGVIKLGTSPAIRKAFFAKSRPFITGSNDKYVYLEPEVKVLVKFRNWTRNNMLRDPAFVEFIS